MLESKIDLLCDRSSSIGYIDIQRKGCLTGRWIIKIKCRVCANVKSKGIIWVSSYNKFIFICTIKYWQCKRSSVGVRNRDGRGKGLIFIEWKSRTIRICLRTTSASEQAGRIVNSRNG